MPDDIPDENTEKSTSSPAKGCAGDGVESKYNISLGELGFDPE